MARLARCGYRLTRPPAYVLKFTKVCARVSHVACLFAVLLFTLATAAIAQDVRVHIDPPPPAPPAPSVDAMPASDAGALDTNHPKPSVQVDVNLVLVPVTVTDDWNRIVTGLEKQNFSISEGNELQEVKSFSNEDAPLSVGIVFDMSGSMSDKIARAKDAVLEFCKTANPQDEFFLVTFSDRPEIIADFTRQVEDVQGPLVYTVPKGRTALLDAIYMALNKMKGAHNTKKALLIISDGGDNHSRYTENEIRSMVKEADVQIYSIGIFSPNPAMPEEAAGPGMLTDISEVTGGRMFTLNNVNELADVATKIGIELRNQYVIGYRPSNKTRDGRWRKIKVKLTPPQGLPHLNVFARAGYYAPSQ